MEDELYGYYDVIARATRDSLILARGMYTDQTKQPLNEPGANIAIVTLAAGILPLLVEAALLTRQKNSPE